MNNEIWMISNRQPWVEAIVRGLITSKTRSLAVSLPPIGAEVYLHASKALWRGWQELWWVKENHIDVKNLPRGGVVAKAIVSVVGLTRDYLSKTEQIKYWQMPGWNCADLQTIIFKDIQLIPFLPCRGSLVPTRKLPIELQQYIMDK